ncbi:MAG: D-alanyl-D-alanine carboxypeptidase [Eubacterium sp.]|nr:D-alanyl-D-alanine carboxypeptidase [Eubacterium sp.]
MKRFISAFLALVLFAAIPCPAHAKKKAEASQPSLDLSSPSVLLMEAETGTILYQKKEHTARPPASVTKVMTLCLIFDAIEKKQIALTDEVTVSEHAASMGGSQVFLEPGEVQTVETLIKCISIASANDACVAMAEFISGNEEEFVAQMNEKAASLGMEDTHFVNCCGLSANGHVTSAYDIALMARELSIRHPKIHDYCTIWMDTIIHRTKRGDSEFGLANTNKLLKQYPYATGLKTGYTAAAKYCLAATAEKDGVKLIAVLMAAPDIKSRTADAQTLLNYGFSVCRVYKDENPAPLPEITVKKGEKDSVALFYESDLSYVSTSGEDLSNVTKKVRLPKSVTAPVKQGDTAGTVTYYLDKKELGHINILYAESIKHAAFADYFLSLLQKLFLLA